MNTGLAKKLSVEKEVDLLRLEWAYWRFLARSRKRKSHKVFVIGLNKTGTTTVKNALENWGFKVPKQKLFEYAAKGVLRNNYKKLLRLCDHFDAFQDMPFSLPKTYEVLLEKYPEAKFVLTLRKNSEVWLRSLQRYYAKLSGAKGEVPDKEDLESCNYLYKGFLYEYFLKTFGGFDFGRNYVDVYEKHKEDVLNFFKSKGKTDQLLTIKVEEEGSYERLAEFLEKQPVQDGFYIMNSSKSFDSSD